jgi:hypothetical protein
VHVVHRADVTLDFEMTWADDDGVVHAWARVATYPGTAVTMCTRYIENAYTGVGTSRWQRRVTCLVCLANEHHYEPVFRRSVRLGELFE